LGLSRLLEQDLGIYTWTLNSACRFQFEQMFDNVVPNHKGFI